MTAAQPPPQAPPKQPLVTKYHVEVLVGDDSAAALPVADGASPAAGHAADAEAAAAAAAAAVEDDEPMLEEPREEKQMSEAKAKAAAELAKQGDHKAAVELWAQAINGDPANPVLYCKRGYSYMHLQREPDAVRDFTICLDLPSCPAEKRFQALLFRGMIKRDLGDLTAASEDLRAARAAAPGAKDSDKAQAQLRVLVERQVAQKRKEKEHKQASKPVVHRYGTATIEEIDGDDDSVGAQEALVHERVAAWEEVALKTASQARGSAARLAKALEAERKRIREENKARAERNAVRAARRREAAERARQAAQQAQQAQQEAQQADAQSQQQQVWVERTRIPIQTVEGIGAAGGSRSGSSRSESSRSTHSRQAGYESESESEVDAGNGAAAGQVWAEQAEQQQGAGQAAAAEPAAEPAPPPTSDAAEPAAQQAAVPAKAAATEDAEQPPAEGSPVAVAAAEESQASAAADDEVINLLESAEALAAAEEAHLAVASTDDEEEEEQEAEGEAEAAAGGEPASAMAAMPGDQEEQPFVEPSGQERAAALMPEEQLDALKAEADQLQRELKHEAAEERYARYLRLRPSDPRAWSNRAENCIKPERWQEALQFCNEGLAITTPSHPLGKYKLLSRRGRAYHGLGRLQEALRDFEAAEAGAEAEGDIKHKHDVTKRIAKLLREMEANGIERAPRTAAELGLQASAAAQQLELPSIPVVPQGPQHEVPASLGVAEEEEQSQQQKKKPAARKAAVPTAATGIGAAAGCEAAATGAAAPQETATAAVAPVAGAAEGRGDADGARAGEGAVPADQKQASVDAKLKGNACFQRHQWQQAVRHYDRAIELDPQNKEAMCNKAAALLKLKQWPEAAAVAEQALLVDPRYRKARWRKAHAHAGMEEWNMALLNMQIVVDEMREEGTALDKEDLRFLAECQRKQDEAVAEGRCSFAF